MKEYEQLIYIHLIKKYNTGFDALNWKKYNKGNKRWVLCTV